MRVSDQMLYDRAQVDGAAGRSRLDQATARSSTGVRVAHPGDDPGAAGQVVVERARMHQLDALATSTGRAADEITAADGSLDQISTAISRASELAVQLSSSQYSAAERAAGAKEVQGLISTVVASLNVMVGNRYVFGGTQDSTPPFDGLALDAAGSVDAAATGTYRGAADVRRVEIAPGVLQDASVRADVALRGAGGGVDVIATLSSLANALSANDAAAVGATISQLAQGTTQLSTARAQSGAILNALDAATAANQAARDDAKRRISGLADADEIQSASDLALAQHALDASLTAIARSFKFSLLDKL